MQDVIGMCAAPAAMMMLLFSSDPTSERPRAETNLLTVLTEFEDSYSELAYESMQTEIALILEPVGMSTECRLYRTGQATEVMSHMVVVRLSGGCRSEGHNEPALERKALGWTHITDGVVSPFVEVDCDQIRKLTSARLASAGWRARAQFFGRALGRVMAHEIFHVLCKTKRHARTGVAKGQFSSYDLLEEELRFEGESIRRLKSSVRGERPASWGR